jgi:anti-sigma factor RsiW
MNFVTTHPFAAEELMAFCDGELSAQDSQAVEIHLAGCRDCADKVRQFHETLAVAPRVECASGFKAYRRGR